MDDSENFSTNPKALESDLTIGAVIDRRLTRRGFTGGLAAVYAMAVMGCGKNDGEPSDLPTRNIFKFDEVSRNIDMTHQVSKNYNADILIRWGDPLFENSPAFDPYAQTADAQKRQFGFNNDYVGYVALGPDRGILCVNHEYTSTDLMFPNVTADYPASITLEHCQTEIAAHGASIVEIRRNKGIWKPIIGADFNRRITGDTPMQITGPAAGHARLKTTADASGNLVLGTLNNCAGGITPWGTYLMAEENFNGYFRGDLPSGHAEAINHKRYGVPGGWYQWGRFIDRFNLEKEPNEPNRFGWVVEVDPMDSNSVPKKRTALGRFKHEGAESVMAPSGQLVVYMGDDQRFDYLYKFVSKAVVNLNDRSANANILDDGVLYVAKFLDTGVLEWMPLLFDQGPLTQANGFFSQADVLIETRRAADLLGATPMDRPEDVEPDANSGRVWVMLTNNARRRPGQTNAANPRALNAFGHIVQINEPAGDFAATKSSWDILVKCGDPGVAEIGATWNPLTSADGWFTCPDNCAVDPHGRLWISTDGNEKSGAADGLWTLETDGPEKATGRAFFRAPIGAEVCGPRFTADGKTLFLAIQHPGDGHNASFEKPTTRWPDFDENIPPRSAILAITHKFGKTIGEA